MIYRGLMIKKVSPKLDVSPKLLEWSINTAGLEKKDVIEKLKIGERKYEGLISGKEKITLNQLELLAEKTQRPLASFFLSSVPEEKPLPKDNRLHPSHKGKFSRKTLLAIRKARRLQEITKELSSNLKEREVSRVKKSTLDKDPKEVAEELRNKFDITEDKQRKFKDSYKLFNFLREELEKENIFAFQISMPVEDARGFALSDDHPKIVVVNSADLIEARIFTLMHEIGHVILGHTSLDIPDFEDNDKIEKWCNEFASGFLLPDNLVKKIYEENNQNILDSNVLKSVSRKFKVSKSMILYNMVKSKLVSHSNYIDFLERFKKKDLVEVSKKKGGAGVPADRKCLSELGNKFVALVADNIDKKQITYSDALSYLSIKSKNFNKLLNKL